MRNTFLLLCVFICLSICASGQTPSRAVKARATAGKRAVAVRRVVRATQAPPAIGPYSQAIAAGDFIYTSGQIALDPKTGEMIAGGVAEQTEQVLKNLSAVLAAAGSGLEQVVKTTVFLTDMDDFAAMNEVYQKYFKTEPPARSTVGVARLPRGARIEIEAIAIKRK